MSNHLLLNDVRLLLVEIKSHLQKKPEMLVVVNRIDRLIEELEDKLIEKNINKIPRSYLLTIIAKIIDCLPSITNLFNKFFS